MNAAIEINKFAKQQTDQFFVKRCYELPDAKNLEDPRRQTVAKIKKPDKEFLPEHSDTGFCHNHLGVNEDVVVKITSDMSKGWNRISKNLSNQLDSIISDESVEIPKKYQEIVREFEKSEAEIKKFKVKYSPALSDVQIKFIALCEDILEFNKKHALTLRSLFSRLFNAKSILQKSKAIEKYLGKLSSGVIPFLFERELPQSTIQNVSIEINWTIDLINILITEYRRQVNEHDKHDFELIKARISQYAVKLQFYSDYLKRNCPSSKDLKQEGISETVHSLEKLFETWEERFGEEEMYQSSLFAKEAFGT